MKKTILSIALSVAAAFGMSAQDWANYGRYAAANAELKQAPEVVFMGNSITDGWDDNHPEFFTDNNYACRGISGQVTSQMLCRFFADVISLKPKAVVILAGVNDIAQNQGPIDEIHIVENIIMMAELARNAGIKPFIASALPCDTIPWNAKIVNTATRIVSLNEHLRDYANANGITYVDYYSALATPDGALNPEYTNDRLHPNRAGYDVMEPIVLEALKSLDCCKGKVRNCAVNNQPVCQNSNKQNCVKQNCAKQNCNKQNCAVNQPKCKAGKKCNNKAKK